ncbi:uncharacterized protein PV09_00101 [Verruconis gallopava]|uniref:Uncharacterized protein n=1 Tax=Verruconis gallopava TaxID=253628 RepID=A0A0D1Y291_9PEZI|nr:uncharacterized protein PV09_00101 [Verruconis gallopava]KIW09166.1 hypothetical protein PV09_00101 [Verruconis gallopava]
MCRMRVTHRRHARKAGGTQFKNAEATAAQAQEHTLESTRALTAARTWSNGHEKRRRFAVRTTLKLTSVRRPSQDCATTRCRGRHQARPTRRSGCWLTQACRIGRPTLALLR